MRDTVQIIDDIVISDISEQLPGIIVATNIEHRYIYANQHSSEMLGFSKAQDIIGNTPYQLNCDAVCCAQSFYLQNELVLHTQKEITIIDILTLSDKITRSYLTTKKPLYLQQELHGVISQSTEISLSNIFGLWHNLIYGPKVNNCRADTILSRRKQRLLNVSPSINYSVIVR